MEAESEEDDDDEDDDGKKVSGDTLWLTVVAVTLSMFTLCRVLLFFIHLLLFSGSVGGCCLVSDPHFAVVPHFFIVAPRCT